MVASIVIRHKFTHYICNVVASFVIWIPVIINIIQKKYFPVFLIIDVLIIAFSIYIHLTDYLLLTEGTIEGKKFQMSPKIEVVFFSAPRNRIQSCEVSRFLVWNSIAVKGPWGVNFVMQDMRHVYCFAEEIKAGWQ